MIHSFKCRNCKLFGFKNLENGQAFSDDEIISLESRKDSVVKNLRKIVKQVLIKYLQHPS